jgi:hypothetical protein
MSRSRRTFATVAAAAVAMAAMTGCRLLLPETLGPGSHIAVDVTLADGNHLTTAAVAVVSASAGGVPVRYSAAGWTRTVTAAEPEAARRATPPQVRPASLRAA